jgi:hypothetical protein
VRLSFSARGDSEKTELVLVGCSVVYLRWGCWEAQLLGRSEGVQARIHLPGSDTYILKEELWPGVEFAIGRAHQQWRFCGSYATHGGGRRVAFSRGYAALRFGRLAVFRPLLHLLVEWRPFNFLPASEPEGR